MSRKKPKGRMRALAVQPQGDGSPPAQTEAAISKTQKRKQQKKRAKLAAVAERAKVAEEKAVQKAALAEQKALRAAAAPAPSVPHPPPQPLAFEAEEDDHCETAPTAYAHIAPLLQMLAETVGIPADTLRVYDPFYCNGAVTRHLAALGFPRVHNVNEDCYAVWRDGPLPAHNVVVTNPPYSGEHPESLLRFLRGNGKPWLALMPNWVVSRPYFAALAPDDAFFLVPASRYHYWTPKGRRSDLLSGGAKAKTHGHTNAALGVRTSPFVSFWYAGGGWPRSALSDALQLPEGCRVIRHRSALPPSVLDRSAEAASGGSR